MFLIRWPIGLARVLFVATAVVFALGGLMQAAGGYPGMAAESGACAVVAAVLAAGLGALRRRI